jgi:hypothetical protein
LSSIRWTTPSDSGRIPINAPPEAVQVLVAFDDTPVVVQPAQQDGTCWLSGTVWRGRGAVRVSFSHWSTTDDDVRTSATAILRAAAASRGSRTPSPETTIADR